VDLKVSSVTSLDKALARIQAEKNRRAKVDLSLVEFHLQHIQAELDEAPTSNRTLSLEHLELFQNYLLRLALPLSQKIDKLQATLLTKVVKRLEHHPLAAQARSGDRVGGEQGSAYFKVTFGRRRQMFCILWLNLLTGPLLTLALVGLLLRYLPYSYYLFGIWVVWVIIDNFMHPKPVQTRVSNWWRGSPLYQHFRDYFPIRHTRHTKAGADRAVFSPEQNYLCCYHPHGVQSSGAFSMATSASGVDELFPGLTFSVQTLKVNFNFPFTRENIMSLGMGDASKECLHLALTRYPGSSAVLVTGGAKESLVTHPYSSKVVLKDRKGFVKVAIRAGAALVPMWGFGENNLYENLVVGSPRVQRWQRRIQRMISFAPLLVAGRGVFSYSGGLIPHRRPITVVVGDPIPVGPAAGFGANNIDPQRLDELHTRYLAAVRDLFGKYKDIYDPKAEPIEFIDGISPEDQVKTKRC